MKIYKIEETHKNIKMNGGRTIRYSKYDTANRWDLPNLNFYSEDGTLLKEENFGAYQLHFLRKLKSIELFEVNPFLDYQFEHTEDKIFFLNHIKPITIHSHQFKDKEQKSALIAEWIKEKEKQLEGQQSKSKPLRKIKWNGTQKNLAELFLELEKKGWIEKIETGYRAKVCESIEAIFDLSETKKSKDTNSLKSFTEIMTPFLDNRTGEISYPKVFTERYKKQFENIKTAKKTT